MENNVERINLSDYQKREILEIYKRLVTENKSNAEIRREIRSKLNSYSINYTERDVQRIFRDCKEHVLIKDLFSIYENKNYSGLILSKNELISLARDYILRQYLEMDLEDLQDRDVIFTIEERLLNEGFSSIKDKQIVEDIINLVRDKLEIKTDLSKEDVIQLFENKNGAYKVFLDIYI